MALWLSWKLCIAELTHLWLVKQLPFALLMTMKPLQPRKFSNTDANYQTLFYVLTFLTVSCFYTVYCLLQKKNYRKINAVKSYAKYLQNVFAFLAV